MHMQTESIQMLGNPVTVTHTCVHLRPVQARWTPVTNMRRSQRRVLRHELQCLRVFALFFFFSAA